MILWVLLFAALLFGAYLLDQIDQVDQFTSAPLEPKSSASYASYQTEKKALDQFVGTYFLSQGLMATNLRFSAQNTLASGEDLLSESVGLLLLYYVDTDQEVAFMNQLQLAEQLLQKENGLFQWRTREGQRTAVNASVDDLRIAKALILGSKKWHREDLKEKSITLSKALLKYCIKDDLLLSFDAPTSGEAPFFYYDFRAMLLLADNDSKWQNIAQKSFSNIHMARLPLCPFYSNTDKSSGKYPTLENTLIILHMAEVGQLNQNDLRWFKLQMNRGSIFASYNVSGKPTSTVESPAIYGLLAQLGKFANDPELYDLAGKKLKTMQHLKNDTYYGGYINTSTGEAYSFDHLMALLGY